MLSTMYMVEQKTIPVNLPQATSAAIDNKTNFTVTLKDDGSIYLEDQQTDIQTLLMQATKEQKIIHHLLLLFEQIKILIMTK